MVASTVDFDDNTLLLSSSRQKVFTNAELVQLAKILKLDTSPPAATAQRAQRPRPKSGRSRAGTRSSGRSRAANFLVTLGWRGFLRGPSLSIQDDSLEGSRCSIIPFHRRRD
jgi:hypothetical protein